MAATTANTMREPVYNFSKLDTITTTERARQFLEQLNRLEYYVESTLRKRKTKMNRHKRRKRLKKQKYLLMRHGRK